MARSRILQILLWPLTYFNFIKTKRSLKKHPHNTEMLHRFVLKKKYIRPDGTVDAKAFLLVAKDKGKLSTFRELAMSAAECGSRFNDVYGCLGVRAGSVRAIDKELARGIDAIADPDESTKCPGHVSIINLPDPEIPADYLLAERAASMLREQSTRIILEKRLGG